MKKFGLACLAVLLVASVSVGCKQEDKNVDGKMDDKKAQLETTVPVDEVPLPEISPDQKDGDAVQKQTSPEQKQITPEQAQIGAEQKEMNAK